MTNIDRMEADSAGVGWCGRISVHFRFKHGSCELTIGSGNSIFTALTTSIVDGFTDFVDSVADLAEGRQSTAVIWGAEPGGLFIDTSKTFEKVLSIVIASMSNDGWLSPSDWSPERGPTLWKAMVDRQDFTIATYRAISNLITTSTTLINGWPWGFPYRAYTRLEVALNGAEV